VTPEVVLPPGSTSKVTARPHAAGDVRARSPALLICVGLALFVVASRLEAAVGAFSASAAPVGALQLGLAALVGLWAARAARAPSRRLLRVGAAGACALAALWIVTRTVDAGGPAPVGVLDALTALDELLLAAFAVAATFDGDPAGRQRRRWEGWSAGGSIAISLSFVALAMGCEPAAAPASGGRPSGVTPLVCHLY
jgi:hypothetical protein